MHDDLILPELSYRVVGAFYEVHNVLKTGLLERSYQEALEIELTDRGIRCEREVAVALHYKGRKIHGFRLDLVVEGKIILECKTSETYHTRHDAQLRNYLSISGLPLGMILLFGSSAVHKRFVGV